MARPAAVFATIGDQKQRDELYQLWKNHPNHYTRMRAHAIILSDSQFTLEQLTAIFGVNRDSVRAWMTRFERGGVEGLLEADRSGGPPRLDDQEQEILKDLLRQYPSHPAKVLARLRDRTGKSLSLSALRRYAKHFGLSWKRFRRSLRKRRDQRAFDQARDELAELLAEPSLNVVYFDESGFSLKGVIPYGWLPVGERTDIPLSGGHGKTAQAIGFEGQEGEVDAYLHQGYVKSETIIKVFDDYAKRLDQTTVVVLDNASCHTSNAFQACLERWAEQGLLVYYLPPYSPELNSIERLWRKIKYQLMPAEAWEQFGTLIQTLTEKLQEIGEVTHLPSIQS